MSSRTSFHNQFQTKLTISSSFGINKNGNERKFSASGNSKIASLSRPTRLGPTISSQTDRTGSTLYSKPRFTTNLDLKKSDFTERRSTPKSQWTSFTGDTRKANDFGIKRYPTSSAPALRKPTSFAKSPSTTTNLYSAKNSYKPSNISTKSVSFKPKVNFSANTCRICERCFDQPDRLVKHETICSSVALKSRPKFDSVKQRFKGKPTEYVESYEKSLKSQDSLTPTLPKTNWRAKHEYFLAAIREAKGQVGPSTAALTAAMLEPCVYCGRRFNSDALDRHVPICEKLTSKARYDRKRLVKK